jgi:hypothetical protein
MIALVAAIETSREADDRGRQDWLADSWVRARAMAADQTQGRAVLCFGDSQVQQGLHPRWIAGRSSQAVTGLNLAVPGGQPASSYYLLRRAIEAGARPDAVVIGHYPGLLIAGPEINRAVWPELLRWNEAIELAWSARSPDFLTRDLLRRLVPTFNRRDRLRERIAGALAGASASDETHQRTIEHRTQARENDGALAMPVNPDFRDSPPPPPDPRTAARTWRPHPVQDRYMRRFLDLAEAHDVRVFWLMSALSPATRGDPARSRVDDGLDQYATSLMERHPGLVVLDARMMDLDASLFHDPVHLNHVGAAALSASIGDELRATKTGPGPRWVALRRDEPARPIVRTATSAREAMDVHRD